MNFQSHELAEELIAASKAGGRPSHGVIGTEIAHFHGRMGLHHADAFRAAAKVSAAIALLLSAPKAYIGGVFAHCGKPRKLDPMLGGD